MKKTLAIFLLVSLNAGIGPIKSWAQDGESLYIRKCAGCHGVEGDGNGPGAAIVFPKPRDFRTWMFKYKTTPEDNIPTDEDLSRIIKNGLPGSSMPAFDEILSNEQIRLIIQYLKQFSVFDLGDEMPPVVEIIESPRTPDVERGKELFNKFECTKCHGEQGRGEGPSFDELKDDWDNKLLPRNLSKGWTYRRGGTLQDIYITLKLGIPGTSMPSFLETMTQGGMDSEDIEFDLWSIAAYVKSLQEEEAFGTTIKIKFTETLSDNPDDNIWNDIAPVRFPLIGQITVPPRHFTPSVEDVLVKAIHNGQEIALLIQWDDLTEFSDSLPDKLAIQMPVEVKQRERPFFFMGDKYNPVNLWVFDNGEVYEASADGIGTLAKQDNNDLTGSWKYEDGRYTVIFKREMKTGDENDMVIELNKFAPTSFFVWDGYNDEADLKCAVSSWYYMIPEGKTSMKIWYVPIIVILLTFFVEVLIMSRIKGQIIKMPWNRQ